MIFLGIILIIYNLSRLIYFRKSWKFEKEGKIEEKLAIIEEKGDEVVSDEEFIFLLKLIFYLVTLATGLILHLLFITLALKVDMFIYPSVLMLVTFIATFFYRLLDPFNSKASIVILSLITRIIYVSYILLILL